jgi:hypothetical protein
VVKVATDAGKQVGIAFEAVRQCHEDVGRLIADLDSYMIKQGWKRMWTQDAVTLGMSRAAYASYWMAKQIYRLFANEDATPNIVEGINIRFFAADKSLAEPRLVVGRAEYEVPVNKSVGSVAQTWDLDDGYGIWCNAQADDLGKVLTCSKADRKVKKMCVAAFDLYAIGGLNDVTDKLDEVRRYFD